jgi:glycosyltransferase involved in cell wall biosynthesis
MKIGLYIEHGVGNGVGGAELMMAYLASVWSREHEVDLIHHRPPLTPERVASFSTDDYSAVTFRYVPREPDAPAYGNPARRYRAARDWHRTVSEPYDLFVNCTHWLPPFCHAKAGAVLVLFPFYVRTTDTPEIHSAPAWKRLRHRVYYEFEWRRRLGTYQKYFAISEFSGEWTHRRWGIKPEIVYPPVDIALASGPKQQLILSVGRFSTMAHTKKQLEMMQTFRALHAEGLQGWEYASVGGLNTREENHAYFARVQDEGRGCGARVEANLQQSALRALFQRARIFWHATGLNEDTVAQPELSEHFGIATVEAMAAGCVPVVIAKGGQPEIVRHGESGFVWSTLDELKMYTTRLANDDALWTKMSLAAQTRAHDFSRERFVDRMSRACGVPVQRAAPHPAQPVAPLNSAPVG